MEGISKAGNIPMPCPKGDFGSERYVEVCRQMAIRWGSNKNVNPALLRLSPHNYMSWKENEGGKNKPLIGAGWMKKIQLGNEFNLWWKDKANVHTQTNLEGFFSPSEAAEFTLRCYKAIKAIDPTIEVVLGGLAGPFDNYVRAMAWWCEVHNEGKFCCDSIAYHNYNSSFGTQRQGATGLPAELTTHLDDVRRFNQLAYELSISGGVYETETGYGISLEQPEQAVRGVGPWDRFEIQGFYTIRTAFSFIRGGGAFVTHYQLNDDSAYVNNEGKAQTPWDTAMGIDGGNRQIPVPRVAIKYLSQVRKALWDYTVTTPGNEKANVTIDRLDRPGHPTAFHVVVPKEEDIREKVTIPLPGVQKVTIGTLANDKWEINRAVRDVNGSVTVEATLSPLFIFCDRELPL